MKRKTKKQKPTQAQLYAFVKNKVESKINRLKAHANRYFKITSAILDKLESQKNQLMKTTKIKPEPKIKSPRKKVKRAYNRTRNVVKNTHRQKTASAKIMPLKTKREFKSDTINSLFMQGLMDLGKPSMTHEIASRIRKINPEGVKKFAKNKKQLYRHFYNSAFQLSKSGEVKRHPAGGKAFEYGLKDWKFSSNHHHQNTA